MYMYIFIYIYTYAYINIYTCIHVYIYLSILMCVCKYCTHAYWCLAYTCLQALGPTSPFVHSFPWLSTYFDYLPILCIYCLDLQNSRVVHVSKFHRKLSKTERFCIRMWGLHPIYAKNYEYIWNISIVPHPWECGSRGGCRKHIFFPYVHTRERNLESIWNVSRVPHPWESCPGVDCSICVFQQGSSHRSLALLRSGRTSDIIRVCQCVRVRERVCFVCVRERKRERKREGLWLHGVLPLVRYLLCARLISRMSFVRIYMCVCVCVCVWERERERGIEEASTAWGVLPLRCLSVCVRERERGRERSFEEVSTA